MFLQLPHPEFYNTDLYILRIAGSSAQSVFFGHFATSPSLNKFPIMQQVPLLVEVTQMDIPKILQTLPPRTVVYDVSQ